MFCLVKKIKKQIAVLEKVFQLIIIFIIKSNLFFFIDVTSEMKKQGWTVEWMVKKAEDFFLSIGLNKMNEVC